MNNPQGGPTNYGGGLASFTRTPDGGMKFGPPASTAGLPTGGQSFGLGADMGWSAHQFLRSPRRLELQYRESFFEGTQHDGRIFDARGKMITPGPAYMRAGQSVSGASQPSYDVPHSNRRPMSPIRLHRTIVKRFTALVFGEGRWPAIRVVGDPKTQDFSTALAEAQRLQHVMIEARNRGG